MAYYKRQGQVGEVIYTKISFDGTSRKGLLFIADIQENELQGYLLKRVDEKNDAAVYLSKTPENKLKYDYVVDVGTMYRIDKNSFYFVSDISLEETDKVSLWEGIQEVPTDMQSSVLQEKVKTKSCLALLEDTLDEFVKTPETLIEYVMFHETFHYYSQRNTLILFRQNPRAKLVKTAKQWMDEHGAKIKKGEKAMYLLRPIFYDSFYREGENKWVQMKYANNEERIGIANKKIKTITKTQYKEYPVFDIVQTLYPPEEYPKVLQYGVKDEAVAETYSVCKLQIESKGVQVLEKPIPSVQLKGYYVAEKRQITVNENLQDTAKMQTLLHEFSHYLLHTTTTQKNKNIMELEAELLAVLLSNKMQISIDENSISYIQNHFKSCLNQKDFSLQDIFQRLEKQVNYMEKEFIQPVQMKLEKSTEQTQRKGKEVSENFLKQL